MWLCKFELLSFLERITERIHFLWYIWRCFVDRVFAWFRPIRTPYRCWKLCSNVLYMIALVGCLLVFILSDKFHNTENFPLVRKKFYRSENAQTPRYLLLSIDDRSESRCKPIFESSVPYSLQQNITDKELIDSLFGKRINRAYAIRSYPKERAPIMQEKLCFNSSNEWVLLTILEKGSQQRSISENLQAIEVSLDESREAHQCISFDLEKCSLNNFGNDDYPKLVQLDQEQRIKVVGTRRVESVYTETVPTVHYYIRRKAADVFRHRKRLTEIDSAPLNMTIVPDLISSHERRIRVKTTQNSTLYIIMAYMTSLHEEGLIASDSSSSIVIGASFNPLSPSTKHEICINCDEINKTCINCEEISKICINCEEINKTCINCEGINKICTQIETSKRKLFDYQSYTESYSSKDIPATISKYAVVVVIAIFVFVLMILISILYFKPINVGFISCWPCKGPSTVESVIAPPDNYLPTPVDTVSVTTAYGIINQERRSSFTSLDSLVINPP